MKNLLIKYAVAVLAIGLVTRIISALILEIFPDLLRVEFEGGYSEYGIGILFFYITTLLNIPLAFHIGSDLKERKLRSIPLQFFTVLSNIGGVIILLLVIQNQINQTTGK